MDVDMLLTYGVYQSNHRCPYYLAGIAVAGTVNLWKTGQLLFT